MTNDNQADKVLQPFLGPALPNGIQRLPTGVAGLDTILGGGLLKGDSYIIMGVPGTGKTILSNQIAFNHIAAGGRVIYLTIITETHSRMIGHLRAMTFFDIAAISNTLYYISSYGTLAREGLPGLLALCKSIIRQHQTTLLILDGLGTAEDFAASAIDFKSFIKTLDSYSEMNGCTTLLLTHRTDGGKFYPEYTMVDGLIELGDQLNGLRNERYLHVLKFRGSAFLQGLHTLDITSDGIAVYPRPEVLLNSQEISLPSEKRVQFGIAGLDSMLGGGVLEATTTMLFGPTGSGKTSLGLHFLAEGLALGESCLHFGFYESPARLLHKAREIGLDLETYCQSGLLEISWQPPVERDLDILAAKLLDLVRERKIKRLFIDALGAFYQVGNHPDRLSRYWAALTNELRAIGVTTVFSLELTTIFGSNLEVPIYGVSAISENIILLRLTEHQARLRFLISVLKQRESNHAREVQELTINKHGIFVTEIFAETERAGNSANTTTSSVTSNLHSRSSSTNAQFETEDNKGKN